MRKYQKYTKWIVPFVFGVALIVVYKTFDNISNVFNFVGDVFAAITPFVVGFIIAYILNLPCKKLEKFYTKTKLAFIQKKAKSFSIITIYVILLLVLMIFIRTIIPNLYSNIVDLYNNIIPFTQNAIAEIERLQENLGIAIFEINEDTAKEAVQKILNSINIKEFGKYAQGAFNFTSGIFKAFIALIISVYMLIDRDKIFKTFKRLLSVFFSKEKGLLISKYMGRINKIFQNYIYSCVLDAIIVAILATIILSLIGVKYAIIFGTLIGICNLIPYFGSIISNIITVIVTIFTGGWFKALWVAVALFILGQVDGNFIGPKIMGNKLEARPLLIIFAVTLGGGLFGVGGMVLSVPVVMVIRMILSEIIINIEEKKKIEKISRE